MQEAGTCRKTLVQSESVETLQIRMAKHLAMTGGHGFLLVLVRARAVGREDCFQGGGSVSETPV